MAPSERRVTPYASLALERSAPLGGEIMRLTPIGAIIHSGNTRLTIIGENNGTLAFQEVQNFSGEDVAGANGRLVRLNEYDDVFPAQLTLGSAHIQAFDTLRKTHSVDVRFAYTNPITQQEEHIAIEEEEMLQLFAGRKGGIVRFSGSHLPEETALLIERDVEGRKMGILLFVHPKESDIGIESVSGLKHFLSTYSEEVAKSEDTPEIKKMLKRVSRFLRRGKIDFNKSSVRAELFKMNVIANARLAAMGDQQAEEYLENLLSNTWRRDVSTPANQSLDGLILDAQVLDKKDADERARANQIEKIRQEAQTALEHAELDSVAKVEAEQKFVEGLNTDAIRDLYVDARSSLYTSNPASIGFIYALEDMIATASAIEQFDDLLSVLNRIKGYKFFKQSMYVRRRVNDQTVNYAEVSTRLKIEELVGSLFQRRAEVIK